MTAPVALQRIQVGAAASLSVQFLDQDGEPTAAVGAVTVDVARADGTAIATGAATTTTAGPPPIYNYALSAANNARLDLLTLTWKDAGVARTTSNVDVVGGYYWTVAELRAFDSKIDNNLATDAAIRAIRREVEDTCERITGCAWVPRYRRKNYSIDAGQPARASGWVSKLLIDEWNPRTIRSARVYTDATTYTSFTNAELAAIIPREWGALERGDTGAWQVSAGGTVLEIEHGYDRPSSDIKHASMTHARYLCYRERTGIPDRATSWTPAEGGFYQIATPGVGPFETGLPDVDAVYKRASVKVPGIA